MAEESTDIIEPGDSEAAVPRRRWRYGIMVKLVIAVVVIVVVASTARILSYLSLRQVEAELTQVVLQAVPAMSVAEALAVETSAVVNATTTLTAALTEEQRAALMVSLAERIGALGRRLKELADLKVPDATLAPLRERISKLSANLSRQGNLIGLHISLLGQIQADAAQLAQSHKQFLAAVDPHIEETYRSLFSGIKTLVSDLGGPPQPPADAKTLPQAGSGTEPQAAAVTRQDMQVLQRRIAMLFNRNVGEMLALLQLAAAGNLAAGLLNEVILVTDPVQVRQLRNRFGEITIAMGTIRLNLATTPENQVLLSLTTPMLQFGLGSDNLFDRRLRELELINASDSVVAENRTLAEALSEAVDRLVASTRADTERSARAVLNDATDTRVLSMTGALTGLSMVLFIVWRFIGHGIFRRILELQRAMEAEAAGREIVFPATGDDEIGDMVGALHHFVARRKQAEADLRTAKDRAEGAFAELKELQETLVQTEKMAALGGLVAGVAHELNTPVGVCLTAASLMTEKTDELSRSFESGQLRKSKVQEYIETANEISGLIRSNLERAGDLIRVFKQVAIDPSEDERQIFRVRDHIEMAFGLLGEKMRPGGLVLAIDCAAELTIDGFPEALRQALTVLIDNASIHAYPDGAAGTITVAAAETAPGVITLSVADNGVGIRPEHLSRIFEPFFTTRRSQGGIGLGLHMVFNIATSVLGGRITCESQPGEGTRFTLTIPTRSPAASPRRQG